MGYVAAISAIRPPSAPSLDARREAFRDRLRTTLVEPFPSTGDEFSVSLDGAWRDLLQAFSGGVDYPRNSEWLLTDSDAWPAPEGVWAVRGRRRAYPLWDRPGRPETIRRGGDVLQISFNDGGDVARIAVWLERGPTEEFVSYFQAEHEAYLGELMADEASAEVERYLGGPWGAAPYLGQWARLLEFYSRAAEEGLWVEGSIGM